MTTEHITATVRGMVRWTLKIMEPHEIEDSLTEQIDELLNARAARIAELEADLRAAELYIETLTSDPPADKPLTWAERAHGIDGL